MNPEFTHKGSHDNFFGKKPSKKDEAMYSNGKCVVETTPRAIIVLSSDDDVVVPSNGTNYHKALYTHNIPASLMVYPTGGHSWGMNINSPYYAEMLMNLRSWLNSF